MSEWTWNQPWLSWNRSMAQFYQEILMKTRKFRFLRPICRDPCMESPIQGSESIERVRVDLESILIELESVHRRIIPRNTFELAKFAFLRRICRDPWIESSIQGSESIEPVRVDLESVLVELESVHRRILPSNTKFSCFLGHFFWYNLCFLWIRGIFGFGERYHRIELVKIYLESVHGRIVQRNTRI